MNVRQLLAHQHSRKAATEMKTLLLFIKSKTSIKISMDAKPMKMVA